MAGVCVASCELWHNRRVGAPAYKPTDLQRKTVSYLSIAGATLDKIAECIGIDRGTLSKHFAKEISIGKMEVTGRCIGKLVELIDAGNLGAICFYLKTQCGWKETTVNEHTGANGGPIQLQAVRSALLEAVKDMEPEVRFKIAERLMLADGSTD